MTCPRAPHRHRDAAPPRTTGTFRPTPDETQEIP
jgi:hypothetical protein